MFSVPKKLSDDWPLDRLPLSVELVLLCPEADGEESWPRRGFVVRVNSDQLMPQLVS
jgi:hypothetical protein